MRRAAHYISIAVSFGLLLVLVWPRPEVPKQDERPASPVLQPQRSSQPLAVAAVRLPPPPAPSSTALAPPRAKPVPKRLTVTPLKPVASEKLTPAPPKVIVTPLKPKPAPKPAPRPTLKPSPLPRAEAKPVEPAPKPVESAPKSSTVVPDAKAVNTGRALLRLLEHGSGPVIEIAWPDPRAAQQRLFAQFTRCYGLRVAVLGGADRLYIDEGSPGAPWSLNLDAFSGFMRQHGANAVAEEAATLRRIRARHRLPQDSAAVRIFPRHVDALLLGGLQQIVGADHAKRATIRARYVMRAGRVLVEAVQADGRMFPGQVDLTPAAHRACRDGRGI
ncbi:MAG: hypothetical protein OXT06_27035 [Rhodospirillaceae bacterium]|nr:hypothetical protein [Rhodospirillaceae bacterium]MDD9926840.1 hypothetical protein [Rhodospirillaceae bacterium]